MNTTKDVLKLLSRTVALVDHMLARIDRRPTLDPWVIFQLKKAIGRLRACVSGEQGER